MNEKYKPENSASTQSEISLSDMKVGDKGKIRAITATAEIRRRLLDMGLVKGVKFKVVRVAPLGDPIVIKVKGFYLSLRLREASHVIVKHKGHESNNDPEREPLQLY